MKVTKKIIKSSMDVTFESLNGGYYENNTGRKMKMIGKFVSFDGEQYVVLVSDDNFKDKAVVMFKSFVKLYKQYDEGTFKVKYSWLNLDGQYTESGEYNKNKPFNYGYVLDEFGGYNWADLQKLNATNPTIEQFKELAQKGGKTKKCRLDELRVDGKLIFKRK